MKEVNLIEFFEFPTKENGIFDKCIEEFNRNEGQNEKVVQAVFDKLDYSCAENILAKVIVLNNRYSAGLTDNHLSIEKQNEYKLKMKKIPVNVLMMSKHIFDMEQRQRFNIMGEPDELITVVNEVRNVGEGYMDAYSFSSKYCSWRFPEFDIPIVDSYVKALLYRFNQKEAFTDAFRQKDLNDYKSYYTIYKAFIERCELTDRRYKDVDKYLWQYAKAISKQLSDKYGIKYELRM